MNANLLTLNSSKTEFLLIGLKQQLAKIQNCSLSVWWDVKPYSTSTQIALSIMPHPVFGIIFLPYSVNFVHHLSPASHHPSLPLSSILDLKLTCFTNPSHHRSSPTHRTAHWTSTGLPSSWTRYDSTFCFSSSVIFF